MKTAIYTALISSMVLCALLMLFGITMGGNMLSLIKTPDVIMADSKLYLDIYVWGFPFLLFYNIATGIFSGLGDSKTPFLFLAFSSTSNILVDIWFVKGFHMGVAGVAWATIISKYFVAVLIVITLLKNEGFIYLNIKELKIKKSAFFEVLKKGIPVGLQAMVFSGSNVIIQSSINSFGSVVMAGNAAAANIENFLYTAMNAFCHVTTTFVAQNYGAQKYKRMDKSLLISSGLVALIGISVSLLIIPFERFLIGIYAPGNEAAISYGVLRFKYIFHIYFLCGLMETATGALRGMGKTVTSMIISIVCVVGIRIVWIFTIFKTLKTLESLFISYSLSWIAAIAIMIVTYVVLRRKSTKQKESL
jgi:putative MATE family efflux protein